MLGQQCTCCDGGDAPQQVLAADLRRLSVSYPGEAVLSSILVVGARRDDRLAPGRPQLDQRRTAYRVLEAPCLRQVAADVPVVGAGVLAPSVDTIRTRECTEGGRAAPYLRAFPPSEFLQGVRRDVRLGVPTRPLWRFAIPGSHNPTPGRTMIDLSFRFAGENDGGARTQTGFQEVG